MLDSRQSCHQWRDTPSSSWACCDGVCKLLLGWADTLSQTELNQSSSCVWKRDYSINLLTSLLVRKVMNVFPEMSHCSFNRQYICRKSNQYFDQPNIVFWKAVDLHWKLISATGWILHPLRKIRFLDQMKLTFRWMFLAAYQRWLLLVTSCTFYKPLIWFRHVCVQVS